MKLLRKLALTVSSVTCLPVVRLPQDPTGSALEGLSPYLPSAGLLIGLLLSGVAYLLFAVHTGRLMSALLLVISWLILTGGMHFDGLMDTADGVFSHRCPERMLEIMTDSRVGNFGALTGICVLLIKIVGLASMPLDAVVMLLIIAPVWARWCESYAIGAFPYLREHGMGKVWHDSARFPGDLLAASVVPIALVAVACGFGWRLAALVAMLTIVCGVVAANCLGYILKGQTGDTYGAVVELAESGALLLFSVLINIPCVSGMFGH